jgi:DNA phosphorothioation-associated putative methyltransferase
MLIERHRAAIRRRALSRPLRRAIEDGLLTPTQSILDYGCGQGDDLRHLGASNFNCYGWDPVFQPNTPPSPADVVNLGYVVNVIESPTERSDTLTKAWGFAVHLLVVSARLRNELTADPLEPFADGVLTRRNTFQKFFDHVELGKWIEDCLGEPAHSAAPGIYYVFRDKEQGERFAELRTRRASGYIRIPAAEVFATNRDLLEPILDFLTLRGRMPVEEEFPNSEAIRDRLGSLRRATRIVREAVGEEAWSDAQVIRSEDLLVYLATARVRRRPTFGEMAPELRRDIRAMFGTYARACALADEVLAAAGDRKAIDRACASAPVGKLTPSALYVHMSALSTLPALLRIYEGCASSYAGVCDGANIVKLSREKAQVTYLLYPDFDEDPHPRLESCVVVDLGRLRVELRDYSASENPPILHRKECFVSPQYARYDEFRTLTQDEDALGLLEDSANIGTRRAWAQRLADRGIRILGHRLAVDRCQDAPVHLNMPS